VIAFEDGQASPALVRLQELDKRILRHFLEFCEAHGLHGFLVAGSALGAVRHGDIIPWDDDIDVGLVREEYDRFMKLYRSDPASDIFLQCAEDGDGYFLAFAKLRYRPSTADEPLFEGADISKDIYLDIFPFDRLPRSEFWRAVQYAALYVLNFFIMSTGRGASTMSKVRAIRIGRRLAHLLRPVLPIRLMIRLRGRISAWEFTAKSGTLAAFEMYGIRHMAKTCIDEGVIFPTRTIRFGDMMVPVPGQPERYLEGVFGDFMRLPPEELRKPVHSGLPSYQKN
jgi:lipopolysaccharide cholinephosphotransferase